MPVDSNGNYSLPNGYLAVTGQTIQASQHNPPLQDIAAALSQVLYRSGVAPMNGNLNMNGFRITGLPVAAQSDDPVPLSQLQEMFASRGVLTGTVQAFRRTTAPAGWVKENGGTIGSATSGATNRANADTEALFTLLWEQFSNTVLPIQDSAGAATTRGANAAADFAANKRMPLFDSRTRFLRGADDGLGFDASLTVGLAQADGIKNHKHPGTTNNDGDHVHGVPRGSTGGGDGAQNGPASGGSFNTTGTGRHQHDFTTNDNTGGLALETRPRSSVVLYCIKL